MWQSLLRNWLLGQAREQMRAAAMQAAAGAAAEAKPADANHPPEPPKPPVCHVGLVFALPIEAGGLVDLLQGMIAIQAAGFSAREGGLDGRRLLVVEAGVGADAARLATEKLVAGHRPRWVISTGFAGGLHESVSQGDVLLANQIVDAADRRFDIDFKVDPQAFGKQRVHVGRLLTADRIVREPAEKQDLGARHGALAVDMESIAVAEVCRNKRVRFLAVRVISDAVDQRLPKDIDYLVKRRTTAGRLGAAAGAILRRPSSIKDMWQLREDALVASDGLARFLRAIIAELPKEAPATNEAPGH
jgi:adenosylhomocysteine nucleosidase